MLLSSISKLTNVLMINNKNATRLFSNRNTQVHPNTKSTAPQAKTAAQIRNIKTSIQLRLADPATSTEVATALKRQLADIDKIVDDDKQLSMLERERDFNMWLLGRGREEDHAKTPWQRTPLITLPGVKELLTPHIAERYDIMKYLEKLVASGPTDVNTARQYYKYIIRGDEEGLIEKLSEWSLIQMDEIDRVRLGSDIVDKLNGWIYKQDPIKGDFKAMSSDFEDYVKVESELDPIRKSNLRRRFTSKQAVLSEIMAHPDRQSVKRLMDKYASTTNDVEEIVRTHLFRRDTLVKNRDLTISRFEELLAFHPDLLNDPAALAYFDDTVNKIEEEIAELAERTLKFWETHKDDTSQQMILDIINGKPGSGQVPDIVRDYLEGKDVDISAGYVANWRLLIDNIENMCAAYEYLKEFSWMYPGLADVLLALYAKCKAVLNSFVREDALQTIE